MKLLAALVVLVQLALAPPGPSTAASSVTVPGNGGRPGVVSRSVQVASASFRPGRRFVVAKVSARLARGTRVRALMLAATLTCGKESITSTTNIVGRGSLTPRRIMSDARSCTLKARSVLGRRSTDRLIVSVRWSSAAVSWGNQAFTPKRKPVLLRRRQSYDAVPVQATAPAGATYVRVQGDVKVTACTTITGSRENGSGNMCARGKVRRGGTWVRVSVVAQQMAEDGGYCAVRIVSSRKLHVSRWVHHAQVFQGGTHTLSTAPGCTRTVRVKLHVRKIAGADLVVHRQGTITSIYR